MDTDERQRLLAALAADIATVEAAAPAPSTSPGSRLSAGGGRDGGRQAGDDPSGQAAAARAICLRLLATAPKPRAGLAQALKRKDIPDDVAEAVLDRLTDVGLIDDVAYANSFVRVKHRDRALGRTALRTELRRLGIDEEVMAGAVQTIDTDAERLRARDLIDKRIDAAMAAGPVAARRRLLALLARRGYSPDVAVPVVESALESYCGSSGNDDGS